MNKQEVLEERIKPRYELSSKDTQDEEDGEVQGELQQVATKDIVEEEVVLKKKSPSPPASLSRSRFFS